MPKPPKSQRPNTRVYRSELRAGRAEKTRERILDALVRVMARNGIADISVPLVAKEARVSVPSVYRHFPTKRDLVAALDEYAHRKGSFTPAELWPVSTPDELSAIIPQTFKRREAIEATLSAAMSSSLGYAIRRPEFEERRQWVAKALESTAPDLSKQERAWMTDVIFILNSFATVRAFKDYLGLDSAQAAERVAWAIRAIARGADADRKNDDREKNS